MERKLEYLLKGVDSYKLKGSDQLLVKDVQLDSREVKKGALFAAIRGTDADGHLFISKAIDQGAQVVLCEEWPDDLNSNVTYVKVSNARKEIAKIASSFYDHPSTKLKCIGVTGTNGKTTIATLLYNLSKDLGYAVGLVSTIEILVKEERWPSKLTTPDVITMHRLLYEMVEAGCSYVFMEVSSHAMDQQRVAEIQFAGGVFTNITHDHLDYHGTFAAYIKAKQSFFSSLSSEAFAITNEDDKNGRVMLEKSSAQKFGYSLQRLTDFKGKILDAEEFGTYLDINGRKFMSRLVGEFNMYNLLAAYGVAQLLKLCQDDDELIIALSGLGAVSGRLELVSHAPRVFVDYAHTPDALQNVLKTLRVAAGKQQLITVVGCGGDRDKLKRPVMGRVAAEISNRVILTSDNPRSENPQDIIDEMMIGIEGAARKMTLQIENRKSAIQTALALAGKKDVVLIAGKGHEQYQEIKGERFFFSDQKIVKDILSKDI